MKKSKPVKKTVNKYKKTIPKYPRPYNQLAKGRIYDGSGNG